MSRVAVVFVVFVCALVNLLPVPMPLAIHGHPQKTSYASESEWPFVSAQAHWSNPPPGHGGHDHHVAHTHIEVWAPLWAEMPREPFTLKGRIQLFHVAGRLWDAYPLQGHMVKAIDWEQSGPVIGDPNGVVIRNFQVTYDPDVPYSDPNGGGNRVRPERGWFPGHLQAYTQFDDGALVSTELWMPFYGVGDPNAPETPANTWELSARASLHQHGQWISEYQHAYPPILAPLTAPVTVPVTSWVYTRTPDWPTDAPADTVARIVVDPDLHNGVPGTTVQQGLPMFTFDPAQLGPGTHKVALWGEHNSGPTGNATVGPHQALASLLVVNVQVGDGGPVDPPPTPTDPVDCAGTYGPWVQVNANLWRREFTVTQHPANGGKSCAVVVNGG